MVHHVYCVDIAELKEKNTAKNEHMKDANINTWTLKLCLKNT